MAALGSPSVLPLDTESLPKDHVDKKIEMAARKAFQASAVALQASAIGSLFAWASVLWIKDMLKQYEIPPQVKKRS